MARRLSKRLSAVADMVPAGCFPADVGSDHAWLPIHLVESGKVERAMAIDDKMGPFLRMQANVSSSSVGSKVILSHSDGISEILRSVDTLILAGLGGMLSCQILEAHPEKLDGIKTIILDPHRDLMSVRKRVSLLGYHIEDETILYEDKVYYMIIKFVAGAPKEPYTNNDLAFGPVLRKKGGPVFEEWLLAQKEKLSVLLNKNLSKERREFYAATYRAVSLEIESLKGR